MRSLVTLWWASWCALWWIWGKVSALSFRFHLFWVVWVWRGSPTCGHICPEKDSERQRCCCSCRTRWDVWEAGCWGGARAAAEPVLGPRAGAGATWDLVPLRPLEALHHFWVLCQSWSFSPDSLGVTLSLERSLEFYEWSLHFLEEGARVLVLGLLLFSLSPSKILSPLINPLSPPEVFKAATGTSLNLNPHF